MPRSLLLALATGVMALLVGACAGPASPGVETTSGASPSTTSTTHPEPTTTGSPTTEAPPEPLPPHTSDALAELFDPIVRDLGFTVTRASLVDLTSYRASPDGRHLAVYVAPLDPMTPDAHAASFVPLAAAFLPSVFERWTDLESFDICQEPHAWPGSGTPPAVTLIDIDRATSDAIAWDSVTLADLIAMSLENDHLRVTASAEIAASSVWSDASA